MFALGAVFFAGSAFALNPNHRLTQYVHRIWQNQPGLPQASIYALTQTRDGYLWLGTQSGVVRFDGARFGAVPALEEASPGDDTWYRRIVEDAEGRVWLLGDAGQIVRVDKNNDKKLTVFSDTEYSCLFAGESKTIWGCTASGLVKFTGNESQSQSVSIPIAGGSPAVLTTGCQTKQGTLWAAGGSTVVSWDGKSFAKTALRTIPQNALIRSILCGNDESLWIGSTRGLVQLKNGHETLFTTKDGLADDLVITLAQAPEGRFWVGTRSGVSRLVSDLEGSTGAKFESFGYQQGLSQNSALSILEDREGSLWVGTGNGLNQFLDGAATRFTRTEGLPSNNEGPILQDQNGRLWAGAAAGGLSVFDGRRFHLVPETPAWHFRSLVDNGVDGLDNSLWSGTEEGVIRISQNRIQQIYKTEQGLPSNRVRSLFRDGEGRLWAGTDLGPAVLNGATFVQDPQIAATLRLPISAIGQTAQGEILFAVERGSVYTFRPGAPSTERLRKFDPAKGVGTLISEVNTIYTDFEGVTWIGTNGAGLGMLRDGKLHIFTLQDGLVDPEVHGFVADSQNRLWMAGSKGFSWVKRSDFFNFAANKIERLSAVPYRPLDGSRAIQGSTGVSPVAAQTKDGRLWFSATGALLAFETSSREAATPPPVIIEEVSVNGAPSAPSRIRNLGPGRENVAIDYTALTFIAPGRLTFKYLLEGFDKDWTDAGSRRQAFYTNLPPGNFRFRVSACLNGNSGCSESSPLAFAVLPQFYQRVWFLPALAGTLGLFTWLIHRIQVRQIHSNFSLVLAERSRIARELHDTLIQGFSGITMQLQALTGRVKTVEEKGVLEEIIRDAGVCLQETRRSVAGLRGATGASGNLSAALTEAAKHATEDGEIRLRLRLEEQDVALPAEIKYNLVCIAQEALANAAKHSRAETIEVSLGGNQRELSLIIRDNGVGLRGAAAGPGHYGMVGMRERALHIGADLQVASQPGQGTSITVRLPLGRGVHSAAPQRSLESTT